MLARSATGEAALCALLRERYHAEWAVACSSGTDALRLAITIAREEIGSGAPVALPAYSCFDVATAAVGAGLSICLYDIDPATLQPDLDSLSAALRAGAAIVVVTPLYGVPVAWESLEDLAAMHGAVLIEDAAQGHGASWRGRPLGSLGRLSVLSFGRGKGWCAMQGGAVLGRRGAPAPPVALLGTAGGNTAILAAGLAQWLLARPALYGVPRSLPFLKLGETIYRDPKEPRRVAPTAARLALSTWAAADREARLRRFNGARYERSLQDRDGAEVALIRVAGGAEPGFLRYPLRVAAGPGSLPADASRYGLMAGYPAELGALAPVADRRVGPPGSFPGAATLVRTLVTAPTHSRLDRAALQNAIRLLRGASRGSARGVFPGALIPAGPTPIATGGHHAS